MERELSSKQQRYDLWHSQRQPRGSLWPFSLPITLSPPLLFQNPALSSPLPGSPPCHHPKAAVSVVLALQRGRIPLPLRTVLCGWLCHWVIGCQGHPGCYPTAAQHRARHLRLSHRQRVVGWGHPEVRLKQRLQDDKERSEARPTGVKGEAQTRFTGPEGWRQPGEARP